MSITDELRKYARHLHNVWYDPRSNAYAYTTMDIAPSLDAVRLDEHVLAIADRIDAECERQLEALYHDMSDAEYIELPKDADGEHIRIGDKMEWTDVNEPHAREVTYLKLTSSGWYVGVKGCGLFGALELLRHHKQPTVEDVLREFARDFDAWRNYSGPVNESPSNPVAEYAAKLREMLAGEGDE